MNKMSAPLTIAQTFSKGQLSSSPHVHRILRRDPQHLGEARPGGQRVEFADPLGFRFEVVVDDLRVTIGAVWVTRPV